jgi:hypothetical protein
MTLAVLGLIGVAAGSVGPWVTTVFGDLAGTRGDGKITLGLGVLAALVLAIGLLRRWSLIVAAVALLGAGGVAGYDAIRIAKFSARTVIAEPR